MPKFLSIAPIYPPEESVETPPVTDAKRVRRVISAEPHDAVQFLFQRLGLEENPFGFTPNPRYLFQSRSHREAQASLIVGLECGVGFQTLIAPPGMGKTTLLFDLVESFSRVAHTAFLFQLQGNPRDFLQHLAVELGSELYDSDLVHAQQAINELLIRERRIGRRTIIVIDEAQTLSTAVLEMIRLLSNFETSTEKLVQIVLAGQPGLAEKLSIPELAQLRQRISITKTLMPLDFGETTGYIEHRLKLAGYQGQPLFTPAALKEIAAASNGIPREINTICFNSLLLLTAAGEKHVDSDVVHDVISDLQPIGRSFEMDREGSGEQRDEAGLKEKVCGASGIGSGQSPDSISYKSFYQFKRDPFGAALDPSLLCFTPTHAAVLTRLYSAVIRQERIMALIGAPGTGKSLVAACLSGILKRNNISATYVVAKELLPHIFNARHSDPNSLNGSVKIQFVDDAQDLSLNAWRELLNDFLGDNPRRQIILIGQPQLERQIVQDELLELREQIGVHCYHLRALDEAETEKYIAWRLGFAMDGSRPGPVFTEDAVAAVACYARGIPRLINLLCEGVLIRGCTLGHRTISAAIVHEVAEQGSTDEGRQPRASRSSQGEVGEVLNAAQALVEFHTALKGLRSEGGRKRCDGGNRYRDSVRRSDNAHS